MNTERSGICAFTGATTMMSEEELQTFYAGRKAAGRAIDIETCELGCWHAFDADPYHVHDDLPSEWQDIGKNRFVCSPESDGWIHTSDLPADKHKALYERIYPRAEFPHLYVPDDDSIPF
jgi:hypothetical protein